MTHLLAIAFERAAGRKVAPGARVPAGLDAYARRLVAAGRRAASSPPAPLACLRKAQALFDAAPPRGARAAGRAIGGAVLRLLFDSWSGGAVSPAAVRGRGARYLRYGLTGRGAGAARSRMSLDLSTAADGSLRLRGAVEVEAAAPAPGEPDASVEGGLVVLVEPAHGAAVRAPVRAGGLFSATLPAGSSPVALTVRSRRGVLWRVPRVPPAGTD